MFFIFNERVVSVNDKVEARLKDLEEKGPGVLADLLEETTKELRERGFRPDDDTSELEGFC